MIWYVEQLNYLTSAKSYDKIQPEWKAIMRILQLFSMICRYVHTRGYNTVYIVTIIMIKNTLSHQQRV